MDALFFLGQGALALLLAPLVSGLVKILKARFQNRQGPPLFQMYRDIAKYFGKTPVVSREASWLFRWYPYVIFGAVLAAVGFVPMVAAASPLERAGGIIAVVYLLALGRFMTALAGLDAGSSFGGMGSSREMTLSSLAEPAMLLSVFTLALQAGSTNLGLLTKNLAEAGGAAITPAHLLAAAAFAVVLVAETGRIPVDNPDTHLELTMVHEGMILEYSGRHLALVQWAASVKQLLFFALFVNLFFPWGIATGWEAGEILLSFLLFLAKVAAVALGIAVLESSLAKYRLFRAPNLLGTAFLFAFLALVANSLV